MNLYDVFDISYCINLDKRKDRLEKANEEFDKLRFYPKRFGAIENENPVIGCLQSHLTILKQAREEQKNVLIFEDDVQFIGEYQDVISKALEELIELDWQMFYLGGNVLKNIYQVTKHLGKLTHCHSTHAYGVNHKFLDKLVPFIEKNIYYVDVLYAEGVIPYYNCYITIPMVAIQRNDYSNIEKQVMNYDIPMDRFNKHLMRNV